VSNSIIKRLKDRIMNAIARGVLLQIDDSKKLQSLQLSLFAGEIKDQVERFQNYGFTSHPFEGAEGVCLFPQGNRDHGIVICVDDRRFRLKALEKGEVAIYTDEGDKIHLKRNKEIEVLTNKLTVNAANEVEVNTQVANVNASSSVTVDSPISTFTGDVTVEGNILGKQNVTGTLSVTTLAINPSGTTMKNIRDIFNSHTHNQGNDSDGDSQATTNQPNQQVN